MIDNYSDNKNTQIVVALLKAHGIKNVIASPGTTNVALVASMMHDDWFKMFSSVDERSAAYMACGMAAETGEPVVLTCTGATASRNYFPGLTEAYYRKLPILAITGSHGEDHVGHLGAQALDRSQAPKDTVVFSTSVKLKDDEWKVTTEVNKAILALTANGGGPSHMNLESAAYGTFTTDKLPVVRKVSRYVKGADLPKIVSQRVAVIVGAHKTFSKEEVAHIDDFCAKYNGVVFCDHTSGYHGNFKAMNAIHACQEFCDSGVYNADLLIHIGEVSGEFYQYRKVKSKQTWRVSLDGELKDRFGNLTAVFEMSESDFFSSYAECKDSLSDSSYLKECKARRDAVYDNIPNLPFGNIWIAQYLHDKLPNNSSVHLSIFNTLRSWNFFELDNTISTSCNVGGFGIDGPLSTALGHSLMKPERIQFAFVGDLAFFYDMNCLGNRHVANNLRILLVNNGIGTEFKNYSHPASQWEENANLFMAAGGHFGKQSKSLVKHYAEDLGYKYISASSKEEFAENVSDFVSPETQSKPMIFEVFTNSKDESDAIFAMRNILADSRSTSEKIMSCAKDVVKAVLPKTYKK